MKDDSWLAPWLQLLKDDDARSEILELGCGTGRDTRYLVRHGLQITALDLSAEAIQSASEDIPEAKFLRHDLREKFPFPDGRFKAILASLCLHYFNWQQTTEIVAEIHRCLTPDGLLLCRLNSTKDINHGATGFEAIEPNFYHVDERIGRHSSLKRFFDLPAIEKLFANNWNIISIREQSIDRFEKVKVLWEVALHKVKQD